MSHPHRLILRRFPLLCSGLVVALLIVSATPASAAGKKTRRSEERTARKACLSGDYAKGLDILSDLFVDTHDPIYIFNQGRCLEQNHQYQEALEKFKEFLRTGETQALKAEDKEDAEKHIADCRGNLAAQAPPAPEPLAPQPTVIVPTPAPAPAPELPTAIVAQPGPPPVTGHPGSGLRIAGIVTAVVGVAALGAGVGFNLLANKAIGDMESTLDGYSAGKSSNHDTYVTLAWAGYGVGAACLVTGTILYAVGLKARSSATTDVTIVPTVGSSQAGAALVGVF